MQIVVIADTHISDSGRTRLPEAAWEALRAADVILHAGDVVAAPFLEELRAFAPVYAVLGNNDHALVGVLPEQVEIELDGVRIAMIHDTGARKGREARMRRRFPNADIVVFGHSHIPWDEPGTEGQRLFNPGSPTQRRAQPCRTFGILHISHATVRTELVRLS